jgi:hypothetical protein
MEQVSVPEAATKPADRTAVGGRVHDLVGRLRTLNDWRTGADIEQPNPSEITADIAAAADILERIYKIIIDA